MSINVKGMPGDSLPDNWNDLWGSVWGWEEKQEVIRRLEASPMLTKMEAAALAIIKERLREDAEGYVDHLKSMCPIAFFIPSYDQCQILNAWSPDYEPEEAPTGYQTVMDFTCNRRGKTASVVIDTLLWLIPNDPDWPLFQEHTDPFSRGKYRVFPRPNWDLWKKSGRMEYLWLAAPPKSGRNCTVWHGVTDRSAWDQTVGAEYRKWIPPYEIGRRGIKNEEDWSKTDMAFTTRHGHKLFGKLYGSDVQAWAGKACWRLNFDEGMDRNTMGEALPRVQSGGAVYWAYTPAEARNLGKRTQLAFECYQGKYPMIGKVKSFTNMSMDTTPDYIMPDAKKNEDRKRYERMGDEGKVRRFGGFFQSSPVVFSHFEREFHVLEMDDKEFLAKYGKMSNLFRGVDEGIAHPGTCIWSALLPTGEHVIYRDYSKVGMSISDRVKDIVELSGNELVATVRPGLGDSKSTQYREKFVREKFRGTFADYHLWARKNEALNDTRAEDYRRAGLLIRKSTGLGPEARCDNVNDMFRRDHTRLHIEKGSAPGTRLYVTRNCGILIERLENYLQDQYKTGPNVGQFKGQPEQLGDDEIDSMCYSVLHKLRWVPAPLQEDDDGFWLQKSDDTSYNPVTGYAPL